MSFNNSLVYHNTFLLIQHEFPNAYASKVSQPRPEPFGSSLTTISKYNTEPAKTKQSTSSERFAYWEDSFSTSILESGLPVRGGKPQVAFRFPRSGMAKECGKPAMMARMRDRRHTAVCAGPEDAASVQDRRTLLATKCNLLSGSCARP
jgi:hypothetical protein